MASYQVNLPHNLEHILKNADDGSLKDKPRNELIDKLHAGVSLNNQKQKFWVDIISSANSFELYATDLSIDWAENEDYWHWTPMIDTNGVKMKMAELVKVWWLHVNKNFDTEMLTPGTSYEVSFVLKMKKEAGGFANSPVKLKLQLPNQKPVERTENLKNMTGEEWIEIRVGEFVTSNNMSGNVEISMYEHSGVMKTGLIVNKIIIQPTAWKQFSGENDWTLSKRTSKSNEEFLSPINLPHNLELILKNADDRTLKDKPHDELLDKLRAGVSLNNQKQKFWVDIISSTNSFELYATDLSIDWAENEDYWHWTPMIDTNGVKMKMAELVKVWWLHVNKNFDTEMLTPGTSYEVSFVLKMKKEAGGFANSPVKLKLQLPNQKPVERTENLNNMTGEEWIEIRVGEFVTSNNMSGNVEISMYEHSDVMKTGLIVNKIIIQPTAWKESRAEKDWSDVLNPVNVDFIKYLIFYGERVNAIYDSLDIEDKTSPNYGCPKYNKTELFFRVGLDYKIYEVKKYIFARIDVPFLAELIRPDRSTWIGYVAVATDYGVKVLGRRDILVCWRGTSLDAEWIKNLQIVIPVGAPLIFPSSGWIPARVHRGFYSIYTTPNSAYNDKSARDQVLEEVWTWVDHHQNEKVGITVAGHSLGAALATLNAADIVKNKKNMPKNNPNKKFMVTAFAFASPRVGNIRFQTEFNKLLENEKLSFLRIENHADIVTKIPGFNFVEVGYEMQISTTNASVDGGDKFSKAHSLKNYISELRALMSTTTPTSSA